MAIRGTPWEPIPGRSDDAIPSRVHLPEEGSVIGEPMTGEAKETIRRRARISRNDTVRVGYTIGCPGCRAISRNAPPANHTEQCRVRVEGLISAENEKSAIRIEQGKKRYAAQKEVHDGSTSISGRPDKRQTQVGSTSVCGNAWEHIQQENVSRWQHIHR